jgi:hypothetical protein
LSEFLSILLNSHHEFVRNRADSVDFGRICNLVVALYNRKVLIIIDSLKKQSTTQPRHLSIMLILKLIVLFYFSSSSEIISHSEMKASLLIAFRDFLDWCISIHFMPEGFLWSASLYHYQVGLIGTVSSLCRVHTYVINKQQ